MQVIQDILRTPLDPRDRDRLKLEARDRRSSAVRTAHEENRREPGGRLRTNRFFWVATAGPVLDELHEGLYCDVLTSELGSEILPTRSSYIYYEPGDHVGPHQDVAQCQFTGLISLADRGSTLIYPRGVDREPEEAYEAFLQGTLGGEETLGLPSDSVTFILGSSLVHARRPSSETVTSIALCYVRA